MINRKPTPLIPSIYRAITSVTTSSLSFAAAMAGKELGRREAWCLAAGTVLFNALVTVCIVGVALPRAGSPGAGAGAGLLDGGAAAATGAHSRKLQQVSGLDRRVDVLANGNSCASSLEP